MFHPGLDAESTREEEGREDNDDLLDLTNEEDYIYQEDTAGYTEENAEGETGDSFQTANEGETVPSSVVNLYNQMDTRGEIGSVHSGRVLLKAFEDEDGSIKVKNFDSASKLTGISMYNPKIKHNGMVSGSCKKKCSSLSLALCFLTMYISFSAKG